MTLNEFQSFFVFFNYFMAVFCNLCCSWKWLISAPDARFPRARLIFKEACVLLCLQVNSAEAGFLVACLARSNFRWLARTLHSNQLVNEENKK
jgi:hypothetical protein